MDINRYIVKAKRKNWSELSKDQQWVQGYLFDNNYSGNEQRFFVGSLVIDDYSGAGCDEWDINGTAFYEIDPDTICQCVGFEDKNKKMIWENDIVHCTTINCEEYAWKIVWDKEELGFKATNGKENYGTEFEYLPCLEDIEIVGNVFDNPKLLRGRIA